MHRLDRARGRDHVTSVCAFLFLVPSRPSQGLPESRLVALVGPPSHFHAAGEDPLSVLSALIDIIGRRGRSAATGSGTVGNRVFLDKNAISLIAILMKLSRGAVAFSKVIA